MTGSIINNSGNQLFLPKLLSMRYCREFLDANEQYKHKKNCNFVHKLFPTQFSENDIKIIKDYVHQVEGLTFHNLVKFKGDNNETPDNNSNNKDNNKNKDSEVSN